MATKSKKKAAPVKKAKVHPEPNPRLADATGKLETIVNELTTNLQASGSVDERQGVITRLTEVLTILKS